MIKKKFINAYKKWSEEEDENLINLLNEKKCIYEISQLFKRKPTAICSRIIILNENNIKCFSVSSVKKGVEALEKYNDDYIKIIFGSHYIAEEVYTAAGKHFDTTNN